MPEGPALPSVRFNAYMRQHERQGLLECYPKQRIAEQGLQARYATDTPAS